MVSSPESRFGIGQFASKVGNLVMEHPLGTLGTALITAALVHAGAIGWKAWEEAGPDVERKAAEQRAGRIIIGESPEHIARRSAVLQRHAGETYAEVVGVLGGTSLLLVDFMLPPRRRRPNLPLTVV